jgi:hypothetical protein
VQTWTLAAPSAMNSAASRHVLMPPMPEIGQPARLGVARDLRDHVERDGLHRRAAVAAMGALAVRARKHRHALEVHAHDRVHGVDERDPIRAAFLRRARGLADIGNVRRELHDHRKLRMLLAPLGDHGDVLGHLAHGRAHAALAHAVRAAEIELDAVAARVLDLLQDVAPVVLGARHHERSDDGAVRPVALHLAHLVEVQPAAAGRR